MTEIGEILDKVWPGWQIDELIGYGSGGSVYKITRKGNIPLVSALKVIRLPKGTSDSQNAYEEILNELTILNRLHSVSNIVSIEDITHFDNDKEIIVFIRMELLNPLDRMSLLNKENVVKLGIDICSALEACEKEDILHRDIKPSNIMVNNHDTYKLGDFGISRIITDNEMTENRGTRNYMSPEVSKSASYDHRSDLYSLGIVMYQFLNHNRPPFTPLDKQILSNDDYDKAIKARISGAPFPAPAEGDNKLSQIILKACAFNPSDRYSSASEMKEALVDYKNNGSAASSSKQKKRVIPYIAASLLAVLCIGFAVYGNLSHLSETDNAPVSDSEPVNTIEAISDATDEAITDGSDANESDATEENKSGITLVMDGYFVSLTKDTLDVISDGGTGSAIIVYSDGTWFLTCDSSWVTFTDAKGENGDKFIPSFSANKTGEERIAEVVIHSEKGDKSLFYRQDYSFSSKVYVDDSEIDLSELVVIQPQEQDYTDYKVVSRYPWNVTTDVDWVKIKNDKGNSEESFSLAFEANTTGRKRYAKVYVNTASSHIYVTFVQLPDNSQ